MHLLQLLNNQIKEHVCTENCPGFYDTLEDRLLSWDTPKEEPTSWALSGLYSVTFNLAMSYTKQYLKSKEDRHEETK